jgi:coatomer protein complex subunit gamma
VQDAVEAVIGILGMAPCDGTDAVPPNARSHTVLLSGQFIGGVQALARLSFGIDNQRNVAMKVVSRAETPEVSEAMHHIIEDA